MSEIRFRRVEADPQPKSVGERFEAILHQNMGHSLVFDFKRSLEFHGADGLDLETLIDDLEVEFGCTFADNELTLESRLAQILIILEERGT